MSRAPLITLPRAALISIWLALVLAFSVGILGRGYWTPDEPREADLAWRMSWQTDKAVPLLAGEPFCEKPPLTYWLAGAAIRVLGDAAWVARLPNLLYALVTTLAVGLMGRRSMGPLAGAVAAAAIGTFLLSYQVAIWLATDAPLLAAVAAGLLGLHIGFYATGSRERLAGYTGMHLALALGFLSKSAAAWMVPVLTFFTLVVWERRFRELLRWELYVGIALQAAIILSWVWVVYVGPVGPEHLKVFFWNNLVGRFAHIDAPEELQYTAAHRNSPGKYLVELPVYLWPWTLLVLAAVRRAWRRRHDSPELKEPLRFAFAAFVPTLGVLSVAATARNIYLAPALPGIALLLGWWAWDLGSARSPGSAPDLRAARATGLAADPTGARAAGLAVDSRAAQDSRAARDFRAAREFGVAGDSGAAREFRVARDPWDERAVRGTAVLLLLAALVFAAATTLVGRDSWDLMSPPVATLVATHVAFVAVAFVAVSGLGIACAVACALSAWRAAGRGLLLRGLLALLLAYAALLIGPASQLYGRADAWQDLASIGRAIGRDAAGRPMILFAPDETTRAFIDMYARPSVGLIPGPITAAAARELRLALEAAPSSAVVTQLPGRSASRTLLELQAALGSTAGDGRIPEWVAAARLRVVHRYALPNGRRYALLELERAADSQ